MADQKLNLFQSQGLVMTPQLQQAIKLLQLSNMELSDFLEHELEKNPLLEKGEGESTFDETPAPDQLATDKGADEADTDSFSALESGADLPVNGDAPLDINPEDYYAEDAIGTLDGSATDYNAKNSHTDFGADTYNLDENLTEEATLREHLAGQLMDLNDQTEKMIATYLIDSLDEAGYLKADLADIAEQLGCSQQKVEDTLEKAQQFDPAGVFARSLTECLSLQLKDKNRFDPAIEILLNNLEMLADGKVQELCKLCNADAADLADMIADIKALNPKPGDIFRPDRSETLIPDVVVKARQDGTWHVELNSHTLPRVLVNNRYYAQVKKKTISRDDKKYLGECYQNANWLVKALHQRATTILKVASELVAQQDAFFRYGIEHLRPLTLKHIAEAIEMHESTVSRVTTNKYIATPRGTFELKYFFTSAIGSSTEGAAHSAEFVRHKIKGLVATEPKQKPLSDDKLVKILQKEGVDIARRTVAKYRDQLRIGSSTERKRQYSSEDLMRQIS